MSEYKYLSVFIIIFMIIIFIAVDLNGNNWSFSFYTTFAFFAGAVTSTFSGYVGMYIGTYANTRTAYEA